MPSACATLLGVQLSRNAFMRRCLDRMSTSRLSHANVWDVVNTTTASTSMVLSDPKAFDGSNCPALSSFLFAPLVSSTDDASDDVEVMYHTFEIYAAVVLPHRAVVSPPLVAID
jgi:hypothetical protein